MLITGANYTSINGKQYGITNYGCNYPINNAIFEDSINVTQNSTEITSAADLTALLGCDIQNSNVPLYPWLMSGDGYIIKVRNLVDANTAVLEYPFMGTTGSYSFSAIDYYGQPAVSDTIAVDSNSSGAFNPVVIITKYDRVIIGMSYYPQSLGAEPILVNFGVDFAQYALNIIYS